MKLTIWNLSEYPDKKGYDEIIYTWDGYKESESILSLLKLIEENGELYKTKYLDWVDQLGEYVIEGRPISDHLILKNILSYLKYFNYKLFLKLREKYEFKRMHTSISSILNDPSS